jgi:hypothetical protein
MTKYQNKLPLLYLDLGAAKYAENCSILHRIGLKFLQLKLYFLDILE